ncbi:hypothetical protein D5018_16445 [Parashewanella curva]|uniref:Mor transcription activator domain-containing protein n=1 Tax=Parashewanella curva TaxID=2338552 RepID=A0A3L8PUV4_9GAMM|nr:Mor transcription activator family protein [Parashewanella curva]RLV58609.1 hypothetical protein D5018_16445 [Parashewanella curva]
MSGKSEKHNEKVAFTRNLIRNRYPADLIAIMELFDKRLKQEGVHKDGLADRLIVEISIFLGGRHIYLPQSKRLQKIIRDLRIYDEFNGKNSLELAEKYDLTERTIHQILKDHREFLKEWRSATANPAKAIEAERAIKAIS